MTKVIILAAGRGSRLGKYTENKPKCLAKLGAQSLIEWQLDVLRSVGLQDITIVAGYKNELLKFHNVEKIVNHNWEKSNMVESLFCAEKLFNDDLIITYSDIVYEPRIISSLINSNHDISITVDKAWRELWNIRFTNPLDDAESLKLNESGFVIDIGNKVENINEIQAQYMGLIKIKKDAIKDLIIARQSMKDNNRDWKKSRNIENAYMTDLLMELIINKKEIYAVQNSFGWLEIDNDSEYEKILEMINDGSIKNFFDNSKINSHEN